MAVRHELFDYRDSLEFKPEYQLTAEPLRMDLLIVKKPKDLFIDKNIARIFRSDNILEYKSPGDYLSVKGFLKVYAYANLYAAVTPDVALEDVTVTFVESRYPRKLIKYLTGTRGYTVEETSPGIYRVSGDYLPIQIIDAKKLPSNENLWLKSLANLKIQGLNDILNEAWRRKEKLPPDAYFYVLSRAYPEIFAEVLSMEAQTKRGKKKTFEEVYTEAGFIPEWVARGKAEGKVEGKAEGKAEVARNLLAMGMPEEKVVQATKLPVKEIRALASGY